MSSIVGDHYLIYSCAPNSTPMLLPPPKQYLGTPKAHLSSKRNISVIFGKYHKREKNKVPDYFFLRLPYFIATRVKVILEVNKELFTIASYPFSPDKTLQGCEPSEAAA